MEAKQGTQYVAMRYWSERFGKFKTWSTQARSVEAAKRELRQRFPSARDISVFDCRPV